MEWLQNVFGYTALEKEVIKEEYDNSLFERYHRTLTIDGIDIFVVVAPSSNSHKIPRLPPVVMLHGLGGSMQFYKFLSETLNQTCDVVLIDLPGHGKSADPPKNANAFHPDKIMDLLTKVVEQTCDSTLPFLVIGHSYGTTHALRLASGKFKDRCIGLVLVTPPYGRMGITDRYRNFTKHTPTVLFDTFWRAPDRVGGLYSTSVRRMVAKFASERARREQLRANISARSQTVLQTVSLSRFFDSTYDTHIPECPILIISAAEDQVCPPFKAQKLFDELKREGKTNIELINVPNAGHGVLFERVELLDGLITTFIRDKVDSRLSLDWQLSHLASLDNKWSLKNEKKWVETNPTGELVDGKYLFKGMKVLREGDFHHSPRVLEELHPEISAIIDISREAPPYDPSAFERIKYIKFPTVSKIPPRKPEVEQFIKLVEDTRQQLSDDGVIGVHCHYGFNRTGFFICSFLIEKEGYSVPDALKAYEVSRPPGIKHPHFINELHLRYSL